MKHEQKNYLLDESLANGKMMKWVMSIVLVGVIAGSFSTGDLEWPVRLMIAVGVTVFFALVIGLEYLLYLRRMRIRMDEERVWTHIPLMKDRSLRWKDIHTAAIVRLKNMNYPAMIVLSIHEPRAVLTRKRMMWKNAKRGEELRIPLTDSRLDVVEHCLNTVLPDITL